MTVVPLHQPEPGWLYVLESPSVPDHCKIGMTTRTPDERASELSTGVPHGLRVAHAWPVDDARGSERDAHTRLASYRVDAGSEWFSLSADRAAASLMGSTPKRRLHRTRLAVETLGWLSLAIFIVAIFTTQ